MQRRRFTQSAPLYQRLTEQAERLRKEAQSIPPGAQRNKLLLAAGRLETASHMQEWLSLRGSENAAFTCRCCNAIEEADRAA